MKRRWLALVTLAWGVALNAVAQTSPRPDPWVPPHAGAPRAGPAPQDEEQKALVRAKLRRMFDAADVERAGTLTREQARAGGLRVVADDFERIDRAGAGRVGFDDVLEHLRAKGSAF